MGFLSNPYKKLIFHAAWDVSNSYDFPTLAPKGRCFCSVPFLMSDSLFCKDHSP